MPYSIKLHQCLENAFRDAYMNSKQVKVRVGVGRQKLMECSIFTTLNAPVDSLPEIKEHNVLGYLEAMDTNTYVQVETFNQLRYQFYNIMDKAGIKKPALRFFDVANGSMLLAYNPHISFAIYIFHTDIVGEVDIETSAA